MTLPSELLGLIEALELEALRAAEGILHGDLGEARRLNAARIALEAGIERYREEGQEAAARVAEDWGTAAAIAGRSPAERMTTQYVAQRIAETIRSLHPTPLEEPKT